MAIKKITEKTGKRIAVALEKQGTAAGIPDVKIPHVTDFDLRKICKFAYKHGHYANAAINVRYPLNTTADTAYIHFLKGMATLSDYEEADSGRLAFASSEFLELLQYELSATKLNQFLTIKDGKITGINNCTIKEITSEHLPSETAFLILSADMVKALNDLEANGLLDNEEAVNAMLAANADGMYFHGEQSWLRTLDITVEPGDTGKIIVKFNAMKDGTYDNVYDGEKNHWLVMFAARDSSYLPDVYANTAVDIMTSSSPCYGFIACESNSAAVSNNRMRVIDDNTFEFTLANLAQTAEGGISPTSPSGEDLVCLEAVEVKRNMKPLGRRIVQFA